MTDIRRIGDSGIHTVEGNVAGTRAARLTKQRELQRQEYEAVKSKIKLQHGAGVGAGSSLAQIDSNFVSSAIATATPTTGSAVPSTDKAEELSEEERRDLMALRAEIKKREKQRRKRKMASSLSFALDEEEEGDEQQPQQQQEGRDHKKKVAKNPDVDTSHLPDRERDAALQQQRQALREEWLAEQEAIKQQMVEVVYSWWDGSGHRRAMEVRKGTSIGKFLEYVKLQLSPEFPEVRGVTSDGFLYVKEDLIIPHHVSFYDLIAMKARGKSGPLFHFDVHDDVRLVNDSRIEKDESHPGKIVDRRWYEQNKHIFPASRWELFDPARQRSEDQRYTIHGA